jgi:hypothetical protein
MSAIRPHIKKAIIEFTTGVFVLCSNIPVDSVCTEIMLHRLLQPLKRKGNFADMSAYS